MISSSHVCFIAEERCEQPVNRLVWVNRCGITLIVNMPCSVQWARTVLTSLNLGGVQRLGTNIPSLWTPKVYALCPRATMSHCFAPHTLRQTALSISHWRPDKIFRNRSPSVVDLNSHTMELSCICAGCWSWQLLATSLSVFAVQGG